MAVTEKPNLRRKAFANFGERFIRASRRDAARFRKERIFKLSRAAFPLGNFETSAELRLHRVETVREHARQKGGARGAFNKLCGAREQAKNNAHDRRIRQ